MARFILDVGNLMPHQIEKLQQEIFDTNIVSKSIATMNCIDESNENQFYSMDEEDIESGYTNSLNKEQIKNFNKFCNQPR